MRPLSLLAKVPAIRPIIHRLRQIAIDGISGDFKGLIEYRRINCPDMDTYFAFIYEQEMVILGCYGNSFFFIESIPCQKSERYMWLLNLE